MRKLSHGSATYDLEPIEAHALNKDGEKVISEYFFSWINRNGNVRQTFANNGLDFDREVVVIFQALLHRKPGETIEIGPFTGGGNGFKGSALVYDDVRLDAALLSSNRPDPFSKPGITLGDFNSGYIGGTAHELGHAFGIGHDAERPSLTARIGRTLMGRGNHDFGEELRGKSRGAFLSAASALPLSVHPLFSENSGSSDPANFQFESLDSALTRNGLVLRGRVVGDAVPAILVAYNDPSTDPSDYDAVGWPTRIQGNGEFRLIVGDVVPGDYSLHVRVFSKEGAATRFSFPYRVDVRGNADLSAIHP